jgi:hypothetical protein
MALAEGKDQEGGIETRLTAISPAPMPWLERGGNCRPSDLLGCGSVLSIH